MRIQDINISDNNESLIPLSEQDFFLDPVYFNNRMAPTPDIKLRESVLTKLILAKKALPKGYNFKIFDGYRLLETQTKLFDELYKYYRTHNSDWTLEKISKETQNFVATPRYDKTYPSPHNTGGALDLTIVDDNGNELSMGSAFDEFNERSFTGHYKSGVFFENRMLLKRILEGVGFANYEHEWWHYSFGDQMWAFRKDEKCAIYGSKELT